MAASKDTCLEDLKTTYGLADFSGSLAKLTQNIPGLDEARDVKRWFEGASFKPFWDALMNDHLQELIDNAGARKIKPIQGPNFAAVRGRLIHGQSSGRGKFDRRHQDRSA